MATLLKTQLAVELYNIFINKGINQKEFAKLLNIRQPKVSRLFKGHLKDFSLEKLVEYLQRLDKYVELKITDVRFQHDEEFDGRT